MARMNASALAVLLLWGCASTGDRGSEDPETTFQKIRDTFNQASTIAMDFTMEDEGARARVSGWIAIKPGDLVGDVRGSIFRGYFPYCDHVATLALRKYAKLVGGSHSILGFKRTAVAPDLEMLSYEVYRGVVGLPAGHVYLWYDPRSHRLRKLQSSQDIEGTTLVQTVDHVEFNSVNPDSVFVRPTEPPIPGQVAQASAELATIRAALDRYLIDNSAYPTTMQGLRALVVLPADTPSKWRGPYLDDEALLKDPWGNSYFYRSPKFGINPEGYDLWSWGPEGTARTKLEK